MRKIKLEMDRLRVESFATSAGEGGGGTVRGHSTSINYPCDTSNGPLQCLCPKTMAPCN
jgi:hypothetical protein